MGRLTIGLAAGLAAAGLALPASAQDTYLKFGDGLELGPVKWVLLAAALAGVAYGGYRLFTQQVRARQTRRRGAAQRARVAREFEERAATLGFRHGEARTVERIALRLAPKSPASLLNTASGREYLIGDLDRRIARRQREIRVLDRIKERLVVLREQDVHERESVRVEANIAIWVARLGAVPEELAALVDDEEAAETEGAARLLGDLGSVAGRLVDISEGGAAIEVDLPGVDKGDQVRFWSGDPHLVLGETRAGVVSRQAGPGVPVLHVHFIDPDLRELRAVITQLRGEEEEAEETA